MQDYLNLLSENQRHIVNSGIAKVVKSKFNLENVGESQTPKSTLIKSFEQFKSKA